LLAASPPGQLPVVTAEGRWAPPKRGCGRRVVWAWRKPTMGWENGGGVGAGGGVGEVVSGLERR
jgi:hypothetical protein